MILLSAPSLAPRAPLRVDQVRVVTPSGPTLDPSATRTLWRDVEAAYAAGARAVVFDLSALTALDAAAVTTLVAAGRSAPLDVRLALAGLAPGVVRIARITHLHEVFDIYPTRAGAIAALTT